VILGFAHNVYLPDEVSKRVKEAQKAGKEINLSGLLREAVTGALKRQEALDKAVVGMTEQHVDLNDRDGNLVRLRFTGKSVGDIDPEVFLLDDGRVLVVWEEDYGTFDDVDEFSEWVGDPRRNNLGRSGEESIRTALLEVGGREVIDL
jgi:hypothetical protein